MFSLRKSPKDASLAEVVQ